MKYKAPISFTDKLFYSFDSLFQTMNIFLRSSPRSFIDIETIENSETLVMKDGTFLTAVSIEGSSRAVLADEFEETLDEAEMRLSAYMADGGHSVSFYFSRDPDGVGAEVEHVYGSTRGAAKNIGLDVEDLIVEQVEVLKRLCQKERALLLFWSNTKGLSREEQKLSQSRIAERRTGAPLAGEAQMLGKASEVVLPRHEAFVSAFRSDLDKVMMTTRVLSVHEFLYETRSSIDSEWTSPDWEPYLPGDPIPFRIDNSVKPDSSGMLWPKLSEQVFPRASVEINFSTVQVGDIIFAPITMELSPKVVEPFQALFTRLNKENIPWRMMQDISSNGLAVLGFKEMLASFTAFIPGAPENKYILDVNQQLIKLRDAGEDIVKSQISFCTWAPAGEQRLLDTRRAVLARCIQGWGNSEVAPAEGDPLESMLSSVPGAVQGSVANTAALPLYDAVKMAPLTRPGSPWIAGSQPLRTADGKIMPYQPYSKLQTAWTTLIFGPMGFGKSMFMNSSNWALTLAADNTELPLISIMDVGPSSRGLISLLKGALPKEQQHYVMYERLLNTAQYRINPFDTKLGLRKPLSNHQSFLTNFLSYLATPDDAESPPDGVLGISDALVTLAFNLYSDRRTAKLYQPQIEPKLDRKLEEYGFEPKDARVRWWDVVDFLYQNDDSHAASLAQRYAVPNLNDISHLTNDSRITSVYGETTVQATGEALPKFFWRKMSEAINTYPIVAGPTVFDLGEARVVSLDLDEVAKGQGAGAKRRVGLMYMVAYYVLTNRFFTGKEHLSEMDGEVGIYNVDYREYHKKYVDSIKKIPKRFCIDEKHRVRGLALVENQLEESIREGRKWKVEIMQASQLPHDFSDESVRLATNIFILGGGNKKNCDALNNTFKLSPTMDYHLRHSLRRPNRDGARLLALLETEKGSFEHLLMSSQGPTFLWACNSSSDDAYVRDTIASEIGDMQARAILVKFYPAGNLDEEVDRRKGLANVSRRKEEYLSEDLASREDAEEDTPVGILQDIVQDLLAKHYAQEERNAGAA